MYHPAELQYKRGRVDKGRRVVVKLSNRCLATWIHRLNTQLPRSHIFVFFTFPNLIPPRPTFFDPSPIGTGETKTWSDRSNHFDPLKSCHTPIPGIKNLDRWLWTGMLHPSNQSDQLPRFVLRKVWNYESFNKRSSSIWPNKKPAPVQRLTFTRQLPDRPPPNR